MFSNKCKSIIRVSFETGIINFLSKCKPIEYTFHLKQVF